MHQPFSPLEDHPPISTLRSLCQLGSSPISRVRKAGESIGPEYPESGALPRGGVGGGRDGGWEGGEGGGPSEHSHLSSLPPQQSPSPRPLSPSRTTAREAGERRPRRRGWLRRSRSSPAALAVPSSLLPGPGLEAINPKPNPKLPLTASASNRFPKH